MNSKNSILLIDPDFDPNTAGDCNLLIRVSKDNFSYAIVDKSCNLLRAVYDRQECAAAVGELAEKIKTDHYLRLPFKTVKAAFFTENYLAIPNAFFNEEDLGKYTPYFSEAQDQNLYSQPFDDYGFTAVYNLDSAIEKLLQPFPEGKRYDLYAPLLALARTKSADSLQLDFTVGSFSLTYRSEGQLVIQKSFQIENTDEFNYYLLLVINQLRIDMVKTEAYLSGIIHHDDSKYACISKYFKTVHFDEAKVHDLNTDILDDMPAHYYTSLLALDLCV